MATQRLPYERLRVGVLVLPLLFLLLFYFYPLGTILFRSLLVADQATLPSLGYVLRVLWFTTWQAALSTVLTLALGLPGAHVLARYRFPGKSVLQALTTVPFVLPTLIVSTAFLSLIGPNGTVNDLVTRLWGASAPQIDMRHTVWIILLAHVFYNYSVVLRIVGGFWEGIHPNLDEAARTLGANRWQAWFKVILPQLMPAIAAAALLTFLFCFTSFGVIVVLGGPRFATLEVEIYRQTAQLLNLPVAAILSIVQLVITFAVTSAYTAMQRRTARPLQRQSRESLQHLPRSNRERLWIAANVLCMVTLLLAPLGALVWRSLTLGGRLSLQHYAALWQGDERSLFAVSPLVATRNSLLFAVVAVALALVLGTLGAYALSSKGGRGHRLLAWLDPVLVLPLGTSAVTLGFGYLIAFGRRPMNWITSPAMIPIAHALLAFPFVLRSVLAALRSIQPSIREAAAALGARPLEVWWRVDVPLIAGPLAVGAAFAFAISVGEFGATLLITRPEYATLPVMLYRYLAQPGLSNAGQALAMSVLLMGLCTISLVLVERFRGTQTDAF